MLIMDGYVSKPIKSEDLTAVVAGLLSQTS